MSPFSMLFGASSNRHPSRSQRERSARSVMARLHLEQLEDRTLLSNIAMGLFSNEPTLLVNPFDGNNVVVANYNLGSQTLKISNDGGASFPITTNAVPAFHDGDDSLAFDSTGRLFWSYLQDPGVSVVVQQVSPTTGALIGTPVTVNAAGSTNNDKAWLAADSNPASPFKDNLYIVWNDFGLSSNAPVKFARSTDHGANWTVMSGTMSGAAEGFTWPSEVDVGPNGDVWAAWHTNTIGTGTNGEIRMRRSTDGGATFGPEIIPFPAGTADIQLNSGSAEYSAPVPPRIYKFKGWLQGSVQPRILADPARPGNIYVVSVTNPNHSYANDGSPDGDPSDIVIARSTDEGATWTRSTIGTPNDGQLEIMPAAAIDQNGNMAVTWYQDLRPATNPQGDWLLGLFATTSTDGAASFTPAVQVTDSTNAFDPDLNAPDRFGNQTLRIGEYNGLSVVNGTAYAVWTGNEPTGQRRQEVYFDKFTVQPPAGPSVVSQTPTNAVGQVSSIRLTFDESIADSTFTADKIRSFTDPAGNAIPITNSDITPVAGSNDTQFDISFASQRTLGVYTIMVGPDIEDTLGHPMDQDHNGIPGEDPGDVYTGHFTINGPKIIASTDQSGVPLAPATPPANYLPGRLTAVLLTFNEPINPDTFTPSQVEFTSPAGPMFFASNVTPIADSGNTRFTVQFPTAANLTAAYTLTVLPTMQDAFGNQLDQNGNFIGGEIPDDEYILHFNTLGPKVTASQVLGDNTNQVYNTLRVTFNEAMALASFTQDQVQLTAPGGAEVPFSSVVPVSGSSNTQFDIIYPPQGRIGNYTVVVGPDIKDTFGNSMDQNNNLIPGEPGVAPDGDQYRTTFTVQGPKVIATSPTTSLAPVGSLRVTFSKPIDASTFTPAKIPIFTGPGGSIGIDGVFAVPGTNFTQFDVDFRPQTATGSTQTLSLDDGSRENTFNNSAGPETEDNWVANSFQVAPGGEILTSISLQLGQTYTNRPITVVIYTGSSLTDPHAGSGLTRVSTTDTTISGTNGNFVTIPLTTPVSLPLGQVYWAAVLLRGVPASQFPFSGDADAPKGRSWFDVGPAQGGAYNLDDTHTATVLGGTHPLLGGGIQSAGNLMLRVNTVGTAYRMVIGPDIRDLAGNKMDQNGNLIDGEIPDDQYLATFNLPGLQITTAATGAAFFSGVDHVMVTFNKAVNASTFTPGAIVSFAGPGGPITVTGVSVVPFTDYTQFDVAFAPQSATGRYTLVVGPHIRDIYGNEMDQNGNGIPGEPGVAPVGDQFQLTFDVVGTTVGTDGFGYTAVSVPVQNLEIQGQPGTFTIIPTGTSLSVPVNLGSDHFNLYGDDFTGNNQLFVSSNGLISFRQAFASAANTDLMTSPLQAAIAPLWASWTASPGNPMVLGKVEDIPGGGRRLIIEWNQVRRSGSAGNQTFQVILTLNTGNSAGDILFNYPNLMSGDLTAEGNNATVGLKAQVEGGGGTFLPNPDRFLVNFTGTDPYVHTGQAVFFSKGLRITDIGASSVSMAWTWKPFEVVDGYKIERSTDGINFTQLGDPVGPSVTTLVDTDVIAGGTYYYRVRAFHGSVDSPFTNVDSAQLASIDHSGGFASHGDLTANGGAVYTAAGAQLTTGGTFLAGSVFSTSRVAITAFATSFTFRFTPGSMPPPVGNGITFTIQGDTPATVGPAGGGLGYGPDAPSTTSPQRGIRNSVAVKFKTVSNAVGETTNNTGLFTDGRSPSVPEAGSGNVLVNLDPNVINLSGPDPANPDPIQVDMTYDGTTLVVTITDTVTHLSAIQSYMVDIPALVGANAAYVGFTGSTGGTHTAFQVIQDWTFGPPMPFPSPHAVRLAASGQRLQGIGEAMPASLLAPSATLYSPASVSTTDRLFSLLGSLSSTNGGLVSLSSGTTSDDLPFELSGRAAKKDNSAKLFDALAGSLEEGSDLL
jgi:hypothetical protein